MLIRIPRHWELPEREATPESLYLSRRGILQSMGFAGISGLLGRNAIAATEDAALYPAKRNPKYTLDRPLTPEVVATGQ